LENVSPDFPQMLNRILNVEFTTVGLTIANSDVGGSFYFLIFDA